MGILGLIGRLVGTVCTVLFVMEWNGVRGDEIG